MNNVPSDKSIEAMNKYTEMEEETFGEDTNI